METRAGKRVARANLLKRNPTSQQLFTTAASFLTVRRLIQGQVQELSQMRGSSTRSSMRGHRRSESDRLPMRH